MLFSIMKLVKLFILYLVIDIILDTPFAKTASKINILFLKIKQTII